MWSQFGSSEAILAHRCEWKPIECERCALRCDCRWCWMTMKERRWPKLSSSGWNGDARKSRFPSARFRSNETGDGSVGRSILLSNSPYHFDCLHRHWLRVLQRHPTKKRKKRINSVNSRKKYEARRYRLSPVQDTTSVKKSRLETISVGTSRVILRSGERELYLAMNSQTHPRYPSSIDLRWNVNRFPFIVLQIV